MATRDDAVSVTLKPDNEKSTIYKEGGWVVDREFKFSQLRCPLP